MNEKPILFNGAMVQPVEAEIRAWAIRQGFIFAVQVYRVVKSKKNIYAALNTVTEATIENGIELIAARADGWWLRDDIVWHKPNAMPSSAKDRPTRAHEFIFLLSQDPKYYYDADAIAEPLESDPDSWGRHSNKDPGSAAVRPRPMFDEHRDGTNWGNCKTRNKRDVWSVNTVPNPEAHFAAFPPELIKPCILAGSPEGGLVLDPFVGTGTTVAVAQSLGRRGIGIELSEKYVEIAMRRTAQASLL